MNVLLVSCLGLSCATLLNSCGGSGNDPSQSQGDPSNPTLPQNQPNPSSMGAVNFSCNKGSTGASQQEMPYQQQQGNCQKGLSFEKKKFSDFAIDLDCDDGVVHVQNKGSPDQKSKAFPIAGDGTVQGQIQYHQEIKGDGHGHDQDCWIEYIVKFDGKANCDDSRKKKLSLKTAVAFNKADSGQAASLAETVPVVIPEPSASPSPSLCPAPNPSDSPTPCPSPSPSPSVTQSEGPIPYPSLSMSPVPEPSFTIQPYPPHPQPTVVPIVVCEVPEETCDYSSTTDLSCPDGS